MKGSVKKVKEKTITVSPDAKRAPGRTALTPSMAAHFPPSAAYDGLFLKLIILKEISLFFLHFLSAI